MAEILYRDANIAVLDKPPGVALLADRSGAPNLWEALPDLLGAKPYLVHRLDKPTSGVFLIALTEPMQRALTRSFQAGYTAQQFGHFVKALEEHARKTGKILTVPKLFDTPLVGIPYRSQRLVFHIRKAAGEEVYIPFSFRTSPNKVTIWNPARTSISAPGGCAC